MDITELERKAFELARSCVFQNSETDGFAVCFMCGGSTDPQEYDEHGSQHAADCMVGQMFTLLHRDDRPVAMVGQSLVEDF